MHQIYPDDGLLEWLDRMTADDLKWRLFKNDFTPDRDTILSDLTEADWTGYSVIVVASGDWTIKTVAGNVGTYIAPPVSFANLSGSDKDAYGYYATNSAGSKLMLATRFDSAPITKPDGDSWIVIPTLSDLSQYAS